MESYRFRYNVPEVVGFFIIWATPKNTNRSNREHEQQITMLATRNEKPKLNHSPNIPTYATA